VHAGAALAGHFVVVGFVGWMEWEKWMGGWGEGEGRGEERRSGGRVGFD